MNIPETIEKWLAAQAGFDTSAYVKCFSASAIVHDEGTFYNGTNEIAKWKEETTAKYKPVLKALECEAKGSHIVLTAEVSGTFDGSPIVLKYDFEIENGLIEHLKITS